jgi:O-acetyl-ADP-ribose deacetylase (regulator of RNase III)
MIKTNTGDMLAVQKGILVHGCNCMAVMGSGIAKSIRSKWPQVYMDYIRRDANEELQLGSVVFTNIAQDLIVASALTQFDCGNDPERVYVDYDAITATFAQIKILAKETHLAVHFPLIGCGLANGKWEEVAPKIEAALGPDIEANLWLLPTKSSK